MAKEKGEVVAVVREWNPQHDTSLTNIHAQIDAWGRRAGEPPMRDYAQVEAAVDRLTKRVKSRRVTVHETVTEYVEAPEDAAMPAQPVAAPEDKPRKRFGFFGRKARAEPEARPEAAPVPVPAALAPPPASAEDAWDPGEGRAIEAPKRLQSKAAKRSARGKASRKKR